MELDGANLTENAAKITIHDRDHLDPEFLAHQLSSPRVNAYLNSLSEGGARTKLPLSKIKQLSIHLPPIEEQKRIVEVIKTCDRKIGVLTRELILLKELFFQTAEDLMERRIQPDPRLLEGRESDHFLIRDFYENLKPQVA